jgi:hypothetical protein
MAEEGERDVQHVPPEEPSAPCQTGVPPALEGVESRLGELEREEET